MCSRPLHFDWCIAILEAAAGLTLGLPCRRRAKDLVQTNISILHKVAAVLLEKEQIDGEEFQNIILEEQAAQYLKEDAPGVEVPYQTATA